MGCGEEPALCVCLCIYVCVMLSKEAQSIDGFMTYEL